MKKRKGRKDQQQEEKEMRCEKEEKASIDSIICVYIKNQKECKENKRMTKSISESTRKKDL